MKNYKSLNELQSIKENVEQTYGAMKSFEQVNGSEHRREIKKLRRNATLKIQELRGDELFFNTLENNKFETTFLKEALSLKYDIEIKNIQNIDMKILLKDKQFINFLTLIMFYNSIYLNFGIGKKFYISFTSVFYSDLSNYFGDIRKIFFSYCLQKEKNLTLNKIQNMTSFILKDAIVKNENSFTKNQKETLRQILSGIKYEKQKIESVNNVEPRRYNKIENFDILKRVYNSIKIKYVSNKNRKHSFHSSPIMHWRHGHWRTYKNGNIIWIEGRWISAA